MASRVLVDTGPMVAFASDRDQYHDICVLQGEEIRPPCLTCWPVVTEAAWLLRDHPEAIQSMFTGFDEGAYALLPLDEDDMPRVREIMTKYSNIGAQLADAALVRLAEREKLDTIFTIDRTDFRVYCLEGNRFLNIIP